MRVVKLGGSLLQDDAMLRQWLDTIEKNRKQKIIIVPGGGVFADCVRSVQGQFKFDDITAHQMAVLAMQQTALLFKGIKQCFILAENISSIKQTLKQDCCIIWSPDINQLNQHQIMANWDVTSDSLAAWLAAELCADELILIKSAEIPMSYNIEKLQNLGIVDKAFNQFIDHARYTISFINKHQFNEYPSL